jgi:predicted amidophosphoribosyltransferase
LYRDASEASVIIVDDLVTSGATLSEAVRALRVGGFLVLGSVTACLAKPLR